MNLVYKPQVQKQVKKLSFSEKRKIVRKLELLSANPKSGKALKGDLKGLYSLRVWPYRIIYEIRDSTIVIYSIGRVH